MVLSPPAVDGQRRAEYAAAMAELATRAQAVFWDGELFDGFIEDTNNSTSPSGAFGTWNKPIFLIGLRVTGADPAAAEEAARQRVQGLPAGWSLAYVQTKPDI